MCFQLPKQIKSVKDNTALVEGDIEVKLGDLTASPGDYLLVYGNMAVEKINREKALEVRKIVKKIDSNM